MTEAARPLRPALLDAALLSAAAALTTLATLTAWYGFTTRPGEHFGRLVVIAVTLAITGTLARWRGLPRITITAIQAGVVIVLVSLQLTGSPLPVGAAGGEIGQLLSAAVDSARAYQAPISADAPPLWPLLVMGGGLFAFLIDTLACTWHKVPAAGLVLLAIYSVPSGLLDDGPGWRSFVAGALAFLLLLHLDSRDHFWTWGAAVGSGTRRLGTGTLRAAQIGIVAVLVAVLGSSLVPVLDVAAFDFGQGGGSGDIRIHKPIIDMRRDLSRQEDVPLLTLTTDDPSPSYLRVAVLNRYNGDEWSSGDRDVASDDTADGSLPWPTGLAENVPRTEYDYKVWINDTFHSTWLPTMFPATSVEAKGDWRYDPASMDFLAADDDLDTRDERYEMTGLVPDYGIDGRFFRDARTGDVSDEFTRLPSGMPDLVRDFARSVTRGASNDYERALLLQRWFRYDGGFTYSLERAPDGTGNDTLEHFLSRAGRVGYCEQYASAMAVMARILGIPARVAVGFLRPEEIGTGEWEYSSHDLHAWPELFFEGAGWVRFEPTPAGRSGSVPDYTLVPVDSDINEPGPTSATTAPRSGQSGAVTPSPRNTARPDAPQPGAADADRSDGGAWSTPRLLGLLVVLAIVLALLGAGPRAVRLLRRQRRLAGGAEQRWAELRATAQDLRLPWPDGRSPREIATMLAQHLGAGGDVERPATGPQAAPDAAAALDGLLLEVERGRYARAGAAGGGDGGDAGQGGRADHADAADAQLIVEALEAGVTPRVRQRAVWWPRSLWRR